MLNIHSNTVYVHIFDLKDVITIQVITVSWDIKCISICLVLTTQKVENLKCYSCRKYDRPTTT
jgi:hypothetical protein